MTNEMIESIANKALMLGQPIREIPTPQGVNCLVVSMSEQMHILCIPNEVEMLYEDIAEVSEKIGAYADMPTFKYIKDLKGKISVVGGHSLKSAKNLFFSCEARIIDLSNMDCASLDSMEQMFASSKVKNLRFGLNRTNNVKNFDRMFMCCNIEYCDYDNMITSNAESMVEMFVNFGELSDNSTVLPRSIYLSDWDISNVKDMSRMFFGATLDVLDINTWYITDPDKKRKIDDMFSNSSIRRREFSAKDLEHRSEIARVSYVEKN